MNAQDGPVFAAILAAGGSGTRFAAGAPGTFSRSESTSLKKLPKQFLQLQGSPIYVWSLATLLAVPAIARVVMVVPPDMVLTVQDALVSVHSRFPQKILQVVPGGDTRQASVFCGLRALNPNPPDYVLVHDAARPFLTAEIVERVIAGVTACGACTTGVPPADTIKKIMGDTIAETLIRDELLLVQTPQAARFNWLLSAHELAAASCLATTDDAAVLENAGHRVGIVRGASFNIKITQPEDLVFAEALATIVFADRL